MQFSRKYERCISPELPFFMQITICHSWLEADSHEIQGRNEKISVMHFSFAHVEVSFSYIIFPCIGSLYTSIWNVIILIKYMMRGKDCYILYMYIKRLLYTLKCVTIFIASVWTGVLEINKYWSNYGSFMSTKASWWKYHSAYHE